MYFSFTFRRQESGGGTKTLQESVEDMVWAFGRFAPELAVKLRGARRELKSVIWAYTNGASGMYSPNGYEKTKPHTLLRWGFANGLISPRLGASEPT